MDQVMGMDRDGGQVLVAMHGFEQVTGGVIHYVDGNKRAEIPDEAWQDYCKAVPEAAEWQRRVTEQ